VAAFTTVQDVAGRSYEFVPDGVHLHLAEELYFGQDALGSSDLIRLNLYKHGWWWSSRWNPDHVDKPGPERNYGSATHSILLEGVEAYQAKFAIQPACPPNAIKTGGEARAALAANGFSLRGTSGWRNEDWFESVAMNMPTADVWPTILAEFDRQRGDRPFLTEVENRMLLIMYEAAMANPAIHALLDQGGAFPPLAEVSVLKTLPDGTRRRWRFDRLYPNFTLDLKTLGNWSGRPLRFAVGDHIGKGGYDIQMADYHVGRRVLYDFVGDGFQVFGGDIEERAWLKRIVEMNDAWDWVWLFYQKPEPTGRAPVLFPVYDDFGTGLHPGGAAKAMKALAFYRERVTEFGLLKPWTSVEPLHYTPDSVGSNSKLPTITLPHWLGEEEPSDPAAYEDDPPAGGAQP
jgi:hypothetical protein